MPIESKSISFPVIQLQAPPFLPVDYADFESLDIAEQPQLPSRHLIQQRPSTAGGGYLGSDTGRSASASQQRPSTSAGVVPGPSASIAPVIPPPPSRELDRIRREAEGRRQLDIKTSKDLLTSEEDPPITSAPIPAARAVVRDSKIPSSPMSRFRNRNSLADLQRSPLQAQSTRIAEPEVETPVTSTKIESPSRAIAEKPTSAKKGPNPFARQSPKDANAAPVSSQYSENPFERLVTTSEIEEAVDSDALNAPQAPDAALFYKALDLISAHKLAIAEMVEVMKEEMILVKDMESSDDRDSERYAEMLHGILAVKSDSIRTLQDQLSRFQQFRRYN